MLFRFVILSDEEDDFLREITIDSESTFHDFHDALLTSINYEKDQMTSFFICNDSWEKEQEITLFEMDTGSEYDNLVMSETILSNELSEEGQKMLYVFDYISDRAFFIELKEVVTGKTIKNPACTISKGVAPQQFKIEVETAAIGDTNIDALFFGDESFELEEINQMNIDENKEDPIE